MAQLKSIGGALFFFGVGSIILHFVDYEFIILMWVDMWGDTIAWVIRGGMITLGAVLWIVGFQSEKG
ncbi:MAG: hypothetical protein OEZ34_04125 [Spirochaetia bacterium]|nr:hypothetical protein [Spirochaetia bacterium]